MGTAMRAFMVMAALAGPQVAAPTWAAGTAAPGFAVVELFTSEGCSSCPPADEALSRVSAAAAAAQVPLYVLEWHVDYWDYLGWKDPFGSQEATQRQRTYARVLGTDVYTPEAIVNGTVVASWAGDDAEVRSIAGRSVAASPPDGVTLALRATATRKTVSVHADVAGAPRGSTLMVVLVEGGLSSRPSVGENAGRKLTHSAVVRSAVSRPAAGGDMVLTLPPDADVQRTSIVAFIQDPATMKMAAAARTAIAADGHIRGRVVDSSGRGVAAVRVQLCSDKLCMPAATDAYGYFTVDGLRPGTYTVLLNDDTNPAARVTMPRGRGLPGGPLTLVVRGP